MFATIFHPFISPRFWSCCIIAMQCTATAQFTNTAATSGINVGHPTAPVSWPFIPGDIAPTNYSAGDATCAVDLNEDGWTDVIIARKLLPCLVFINNQDGTFTERAADFGLDTVSDIGGIAAGDFTNSGNTDIFMAPLFGNRYYLFVNDGAGNFTERAIERGADVTTTLKRHKGQSVAVVDYNLDGYLDINVMEFEVASNADNAKHSVLLRNMGAASPGHFTNVTDAAGLTQSHTSRFGYAALWADFDEDSFPDLLQVRDFNQSQMRWNDGTGTFSDGTASSGILQTEDMGAAVADYDGDGRFDVFLGSVKFGLHPNHGTNRLYKNMGNRKFQDLAEPAGVKNSGWSWGAAFLEANNDGKPDLMVTNGFDFSFQTANDVTRLYINNGGIFSDQSAAYGVVDNQIGRSLMVFDYNNDGREDALITNSIGHRVLYRNDTPQGANRWLRLKFQGTVSNRDGYGAVAKATVGIKAYSGLYQPSNAYIGQREPVLHLGLGAAPIVDRLDIRWPSGIVQTLHNVAVNQVLTVTEPNLARTAPVITLDPVNTSVEKGSTLVLTAAASGFPTPVYRWYQNGNLVPDAVGPVLSIRNAHAIHAGTYTVKALNPVGFTTSAAAVVNVTLNVPSQSVARWWNEALLDAIRKDVPNPPVHARNLYTLSSAMWDAYWAYEPGAWNRVSPAFHREIVAPADWGGDRLAAQRQAISHAAFRILMERFKNSVGKVRTELGNRWMMQQLGYDPDFTGTVGNSPAAVGNRIGYAILATMLTDGANEAAGYANATGYAPVNAPLLTALPGATMANINRWQPLDLAFSVTQNGIVLPPAPQRFVGVNAVQTTPFSITKPTPTTFSPPFNLGPPPQLGGVGDARFRNEVVQVIEFSSTLDPGDGVTIDVSPGAILNNPVGTNDGTGHSLNPATGLPYAPNIIKRGDFTRILAEYWADGPSSETPPGHWNVIFNQTNDHPLASRRWNGSGPELSRLEWEIRGYMALNGAVHDAACVAWGVKHIHDGARPISMVRAMATFGQSSLTSHPTYHVNGLPLVPGLIEIITPASSAPGERHEHLAAFADAEIAIRSWRGNPDDPRNQIGGVGWVRAKEWLPYQLETFVSPAFPGYISGHSTFSSSAAKTLTRMTGTPFFPGGMSQKTYQQDQFLIFEKGPSETITLQWATYYDAADQAGISRLYGGIHVAVDDFEGRKIGRDVGNSAYDKVERMLNTPVAGISTWRQINFNTPLDSGIAANGNDPMGDGVPNLVKYALGAAATDSVHHRMPTATESGGRLVFQFSRFTNKSDLGYYVEASNNLTDWTPIASSIAGASVQNIDGRSHAIAEVPGGNQESIVTVTDGQLLSGQPERFMRLKVVELP